MFGIEMGDWPGWIGLILALGSIGWQALDRLQAWSSKRSAGISISPTPHAQDVIVAVHWNRPEPHTRYVAEVRLRGDSGPRLAEAAEDWRDSDSGFLSTSVRHWKPKGSPGRYQTLELETQGGVATGHFLVVDLASPYMALQLSVRIRDTASGRAIAARRFAFRAC